MRMSVGLRECEARSTEQSVYRGGFRKAQKKWLGQKDLAAFFGTMRTNNVFLRYTYGDDMRKEGTR